MQRKIIHVDMDCFFAAVEMRERPELKTKPLAIGGSVESRGVLSTCNYEARKWGLRSAMPTILAFKLCPGLILLPPHFEKYCKVSEQIHEIFLKFTSFIEPLSLDEAFLDVTDSKICSSCPIVMAKEIKKLIFEKTQLTASAGVAPNKFLAKIASDYNKPDGLFVIRQEEISSFISTLDLIKIPGVGKKTSEELKKLGLKTCGDLQHFPLHILEKRFGKMASELKNFSFGKDTRPVITEWKRKCLSVETTFSHDLKDPESFLPKLPYILLDFQGRLKEELQSEKQMMNKAFAKIKFADFTQTTFERTFRHDFLLNEFSNPFRAKNLFEELLLHAWNRHKKHVRLIGIGVRFSDDSEKEFQLELPLKH